MAEDSNHAIVYGASGLTGWALVDQLLGSYSCASSFSKVTAVMNRSLKLDESYLPEPDGQRGIQLVSGIDLGHGDGAKLADALLRKVKNVRTVIHISYLVFRAIDDDIEEAAINWRMLQNVIDAHNLISPNLRFVVFPGGTRGYGIYSHGGTFTPPLTEEMVHRLPPDYAKTVVYPAHRELLDAESEGQAWTWCEVCPDAIIGFTPNGSQFSLALHWPQYLSLHAYNHGVGRDRRETKVNTVEVPFPGIVAGANSLLSPVSSRTLARFMIYASTHPEACGRGQLFNIADSDIPCTYGEIWPQLARWFGLAGEL